MGVSVDTGGKGRGKSGNFDLNLVPFIDLLSVCITFLLATAVWTQIMSLQVDQAIQDPTTPPVPPPPDQKPPPPPLSIHIRDDGVWAGRKANGVCIGQLPPEPVADDAPDEQKYWGCNWVKSRTACPPDNKTGSELCYEWDKIRADLAQDRARYPDETQVIIITDDGVHYEHMMAALDLSRDLGYDKTLLGGGPATTGTALPTGN